MMAANIPLRVSVAVSTYLMRGLGRAHRYLVGGNNSNALRFIPLLLSFPVFKAHQFFFETAYAGNQVLLRHLRETINK